MSRTITKNKYGMCSFCDDSNTLTFDDEERGYGGWHVTFELCLDCFAKLLSILEEDKEYNIADIYKLMEE